MKLILRVSRLCEVAVHVRAQRVSHTANPDVDKGGSFVSLSAEISQLNWSYYSTASSGMPFTKDRRTLLSSDQKL